MFNLFSTKSSKDIKSYSRINNNSDKEIASQSPPNQTSNTNFQQFSQLKPKNPIMLRNSKIGYLNAELLFLAQPEKGESNIIVYPFEPLLVPSEAFNQHTKLKKDWVFIPLISDEVMVYGYRFNSNKIPQPISIPKKVLGHVAFKTEISDDIDHSVPNFALRNIGIDLRDSNIKYLSYLELINFIENDNFETKFKVTENPYMFSAGNAEDNNIEKVYRFDGMRSGKITTIPVAFVDTTKVACYSVYSNGQLVDVSPKSANTHHKINPNSFRFYLLEINGRLKSYEKVDNTEIPAHNFPEDILNLGMPIPEYLNPEN